MIVERLLKPYKSDYVDDELKQFDNIEALVS